jgi:hypothetical protein
MLGLRPACTASASGRTCLARRHHPIHPRQQRFCQRQRPLEPRRNALCSTTVSPSAATRPSPTPSSASTSRTRPRSARIFARLPYAPPRLTKPGRPLLVRAAPFAITETQSPKTTWKTAGKVAISPSRSAPSTMAWPIGLPLLAELLGKTWVTITEADIDNYPGMYPRHEGDFTSLLRA